jgi:DNA-binding PadR family transcriptional regulator
MSLRHALLGQLAYGPASGYDLVRVFNGSLANVWPATQSQIYSELTKLAGAGLLAVAAEGPRGRKEYRVTAAGRDELRRWLIETRPEKGQRNEMLLRVFLLGSIPREQAAAYLTEMRLGFTAAATALDELDRATDWDEGDLSVYGRIALEWGKRYCAMNEEWFGWALAQLPDRPATGPAATRTSRSPSFPGSE